ncbi:GntG family PLP-dependent aldolase [soil metagenome]
MKPIDLRSDTVTQPTAAMREAMATAEVGDDVFGEDPTVTRLEQRIADVLGKEAALFVPSGVMANQIALRLHTTLGDEVLVPERSHVYHYESGAPGALSGVQLRPAGDRRGYISPDEVRLLTRGTFDWEPRTRLLWLENTVNKAGGTVLELSEIQQAVAAARELNLAAHLDGARIWNAAVALGVAEARIAAPFDTVSVCLSKGLGAPVGSLLAGEANAIREGRRIRKMLGGGMRQVGILAAAGLHALEHHRSLLADDHRRARMMAEGIDDIDGLEVRMTDVQSNIVIFDVKATSADDLVHRLRERNLWIVAFGPKTLRAVLHHHISDQDISISLDLLREVTPIE